MSAPPSPSARRAVVGLGSNVGSRAALLDTAFTLLGQLPGVALEARSSVRETPAVGPEQPPYLNAAALLRTALPATTLLEELLALEKKLGRERTPATVRWGPRTLDLDLLWLDGERHGPDAPQVPHPRLHERRFALEPLCQLCPDARPPGEPVTYVNLLATLPPHGSRPAPALSVRALDHAADEGFCVRASDRAEVLAAGASALGALLVDPASVRASTALALVLEQPGEGDERWYRWLSEALYTLESERFALRHAVVLEDGPDKLAGQLWGEPLDEQRHTVRGALKAVTWHELYLGPDEGGALLGRVIVDV